MGSSVARWTRTQLSAASIGRTGPTRWRRRGRTGRRRCRAGSNPERVGLVPRPLDVGRKGGPLVGEILHAVVAIFGGVIGQVQDAPRRLGQVRLAGVRSEAVEEDDVPGR